MSEVKRAKPKRSVRPPREAPAQHAAEPAALPAEPIAGLSAPIVMRPRDGADGLLAACRATLASLGEAQQAVAADVRAMALEMSGLARSNLTAAGDGVTALLAAKTLADAVEIQLRFARRSLEAMADGSARLGEIGMRLASDAAKPVLGSFGVG